MLADHDPLLERSGNTTRLAGKVAIVTGAASGLGRGMAERFAREGALVICADRADASDLAAVLPASSDGRPAEAARVDVTDRDAVEALIARTTGEHGRLDVLVNNAGTYDSQEIADATDESFRRQFEVNTWSVFVACRAAARVMREQRGGRIINTASQLGRVARAGSGVYAGSKAAVILMTQALALELAPYGVTANCICPGTMHTAMMTDESGRPADDVAADLGVDVETAFRGYIDAHIPVRRLGRPADVGALATWLASDESAFMTGAALNLTGGEQVFF
jgi:NAD(P)-dependent dehydrogenase (short-subunit alcohol dehydrogenase family)